MENYDMFALMLDCSRNGVMNIPSLRKMILLLEKMGYDSLMLYTEDTYEVLDEPYFGYLRGRYSETELKELSAFGQAHHVEIIPCIQTLAHLDCIFKHEAYAKDLDVDDILLVDEPRTYALIENMFASLERSFVTRKVHIGMDEAHMLGLGRFKDLHGFENRVDIFLRHLKKVCEIAKRHGFEPMMWSDMFFRLASGGAYYDLNAKLDLEKLEGLPKVEQVYWDYYHQDEPFYEKMIDLHREWNDDVVFAGGVWTWAGFAPLLTYGEQVSAPALEACRKKGVKKVILTSWGDDGADCSFFSTLTTLFFARQNALGIGDIGKIKKDFKEMFGCSYDDFKLLETPNFLTHKRKDGQLCSNACRYFLYNDPLLGLFDTRVEPRDEALYLDHAEKLKEAGARAGEWGYLFDYLSSLCSSIAAKLTLGVKMREAYQKGDKKALESLLPALEIAAKKVGGFAEEYRSRWLKENKPQGLEIGQIRLAGVKARLEEAKLRIEEHLKEGAPIPELEEAILPILQEEEDPKEPLVCHNTYVYMVSNSRMV